MKKYILIWFLFISVSMRCQHVVVVATCYNAVPEQTNADTIHTATMFVLNLEDPYSHRIIAISRDLEKKGFSMGDEVTISGAGRYDGKWVIEDRMNKRWTNKIDFLVNEDMFVDKWHNVKIEKT